MLLLRNLVVGIFGLGALCFVVGLLGAIAMMLLICFVSWSVPSEFPIYAILMAGRLLAGVGAAFGAIAAIIITANGDTF